MKKTFTPFLVVGALGLAACGGVDRAGSRDLYIKAVEDAGFTADAVCVDAALDEYTDDELEEFNKAAESGGAETGEELAAALIACTDLLGG